MARWLKIPSKQKRQMEDVPEPYEIVCVCGVGLSGYRRKTPYRHACQQCDEIYFILPRNSYPAPKAKKKKKQLPTQKQISEYFLNTSFVTQLREKRKQKQASRKQQEVRPEVAASPKLSPFELPAPRSRLITPFRAVLSGIVLIIGLTGYGIIHSRNLDRATDTLKTATEAGETFLKQGDLIAANSAYLEAFEALEILGRTDHRANEIRQTSRELQSITSQAVSPVFEIAEEAASQIKQSDVDSWAALFDVRYADTWMIFETTLTPVAVESEAEPPRFRLNLPIILDEYQLYLELTAPSFSEYLKQHPGQPLIFAAQIDSFHQDAEQPGTGIILLNGKTAFLWSHLDLYEQLGIEFDEFHNQDQIEGILNQQTQYLGMSK